MFCVRYGFVCEATGAYDAPKCLLKGEPVSRGVQDPWVIVGALHTSVQTEGFAGEFPRVEGARVGQGAVRLTLDVAFFLPFGEVSEGSQLGGILHPLNNLKHGDKVDVIPVNHLIDELGQLLDEALVLLQPRSVEVETKGSTVGVEMPVKVVSQETSKLIRSLDIGTRRDKVTTGQVLIKVGIVPSVELVDDHFPNGVAARGAPLGVTVALVGHTVVQGVGPDGHAAQGGGDGCVVDKELVSHHFKLLVATNSEEGSTNAND